MDNTSQKYYVLPSFDDGQQSQSSVSSMMLSNARDRDPVLMGELDDPMSSSQEFQISQSQQSESDLNLVIGSMGTENTPLSDGTLNYLIEDWKDAGGVSDSSGEWLGNSNKLIEQGGGSQYGEMTMALSTFASYPQINTQQSQAHSQIPSSSTTAANLASNVASVSGPRYMGFPVKEELAAEILDGKQGFDIFCPNGRTQDESEVSSSQESVSGEQVPCLSSWEGKYNFKAIPTQQYKQCIYCEKRNKLYCLENHFILVNFETTHPKPKDLLVEAGILYSSNELRKVPFTRCLDCTQKELHSRPSNQEEDAEDLTQHVLRCDDRRADYAQNPKTKRFTVTVPLEKPQPGALMVSRNYKIMCLNSHFFGKNTTVGTGTGGSRKELSLVFTLKEKDRKREIGRAVFNLKVCRSPQRDWRDEEKKQERRSTKCESISPTLKRKIKLERHDNETEVTPEKRQRKNMYQGQGNESSGQTLGMKAQVKPLSQESQSTEEDPTPEGEIIGQISDDVKLILHLRRSESEAHRYFSNLGYASLKQFHRQCKFFREFMHDREGAGDDAGDENTGEHTPGQSG